MKIGFFITARLKSTRLKQKILLDLNGKSVIDRIIERAKRIDGIDGIVLCTSTNPQDAVLQNNALSNNIQFFTGSEDDVLKRLHDAADHYNYDAFISITADNPLFCIETSKLLSDWYKETKFDFIFTKGLPIGCATYLLNVEALKLAIQIKEESDTEMWGPFVNRDDFFRIGDLVVINSPFKEEKRLTIDYPEDYQLIHKIYKNFGSENVPSLVEVFEILDDNYWKLNIERSQRFPSSEELEKVNNAFESFKKTNDIKRKTGRSIKEVNI